MTDEISIIRTVLDGDIDSFRLLVQRYEKPVIRMIKNLIDDHHICEDIAQDVFFTAYRKINSYDPARSNFSTWLFTIAKNKSLNVVKKRRPSSINSLPENSDSSAPIDTLKQQEFFDQLDKAQQNLPGLERRKKTHQGQMRFHRIGDGQSLSTPTKETKTLHSSYSGLLS